MKQFKTYAPRTNSSSNRQSLAKPAISLSTTITVLIAFFTLSGGLWHLGYWTTFNFNYFEYANYTDLFKSSLYPFFSGTWIFIGLVFFLIGWIYVMMAPMYWLSVYKTGMNKTAYNFTKVELIAMDVIIGASFFTSGIFLILIRPAYMWDILPYSISIGLLFLIIRFELFRDVISNNALRAVVAAFLIVIPTFNFFNGKRISLEIQSGYRAEMITGFNSTDVILNRTVPGRALLAVSTDYLFVYNGHRLRTSYISSSDVQVINKSIVNSYVTTNEYFYDRAKLYRSDYYDSIRTNLTVDSIMKNHPSQRNLDSLVKCGLLHFDGKSYN